jgi:hypothetical protein
MYGSLTDVTPVTQRVLLSVEVRILILNVARPSSYDSETCVAQQTAAGDNIAVKF